MLTKMIARWNNKDFKIVNSIEINKSSREVTYTDLTLDFSKAKMEDLPFAQQEVKIIDKNKEIYNEYCPNLPQVQKLTEKREKAIDKFLKEFTKEQFIEICKIANSTDFLVGKNNNGWKADFDFLMRTDKATNVLEGKYSNSKSENGMNDFKELWEEARIEDEQNGNNTDNNTFSW